MPRTVYTIEPLYKVAQKYIPSKNVYPIGYKEFDRAMDGGLREGELITISASSGEGKTTFAQNLTVNFHRRSIPTIWFTYEQNPYYLGENFKRLGIELTELLAYSPIDLISGELNFIEQEIKEGVEEKAVKVVIIDHLHFLIPLKATMNTSILIGGIVRELKKIAVRNKVIIFLIAHTRKINVGEDLNLASIRDCLPKGQLVYSDGKRISVEKIKKGMPVVSKGTSFRLQNDKVKDQWNTGRKKIYHLITKTGCEIKCSDGQKFLATTFHITDKFKYGENSAGTGMAGWIKLKDLMVGQRIAIIKKYPDIKKETITPDMALLLGWVIGDGHITLKGHTEISVEREDECLFLKEIADKTFGLDCVFKKVKDKNAYRFYMTKGKRGHNTKNQWVEWMRKLKFTPTGKNKYVPSIIFEQSNRIVGAFLSGLFQADGSISNNSDGSFKSPKIEFNTISDRLACEVHHLLKRLGIVAIKRSQIMKNSGFRPSTGKINAISIAGTNLVKFKEFVGFHCQKKEKSEELTNGWKPKDIDKKTDIFFDRVKSIEYVGEKETWDIEVEGHHNSLPNHTYCVNDILTHNSSLVVCESDYVFLVERRRKKKTAREKLNSDFLTSGDEFLNQSRISLAKNRRTGKILYMDFEVVDNKFIPITKEYEEQ